MGDERLVGDARREISITQYFYYESHKLIQDFFVESSLRSTHARANDETREPLDILDNMVTFLFWNRI